MKLTINSEGPALTRLSGTLSFFLKHAPHTPLNVVLNSSQDLHYLSRLLGPSARSLTTLCVGLKIPYKKMLPAGQWLLHSEFLGEFEQLEKMELLGRGIWKLGSLNAAMFQALRSLSIHDFERERNSLPVLSSIAPQLHEFALACSTHGSGSASTTLDFEFIVARSITVSFEDQALHLRFALPASLRSFSSTAWFLRVDCTCNSRLSLDSLSLIGRSQLLVSSLPLAAAKSVYLKGPANRKNQSRGFPCSDLESQRTITHLLSSIAPTVEMLVLRYGWPLEGVRVEWSRLRCVFIGIERIGGINHQYYPGNPENSNFWKFISAGGEEGGVSSSTSGLLINAPKLESFYDATELLKVFWN
ncbi:unnamed protein product [Closterium sp. Yama58-4]|nr:unnamed protein product [Closterium sp. Yama58-4]